MSNEQKVNCARQRLVVATAAVGMSGAPVEVDISKLESGLMITAKRRGKLVRIINRTIEVLVTLGALHFPKNIRHAERSRWAGMLSGTNARSLDTAYWHSWQNSFFWRMP